jgi:hypothetical protein
MGVLGRRGWRLRRAERASLPLHAQHQVRFSRLRETRARVIATLYRLLLEAADAAMIFTMNPSERAFAKDAVDQQLKLYRFFHINKIHLPSTMCELLEVRKQIEA